MGFGGGDDFQRPAGWGGPYTTPIGRMGPGGQFQAMPPVGTFPGTGGTTAPGNTGGAWWQDPTNIGLILAGGGSLLGAYNQNQNAKKNTNAVNARTNTINQAAGALAWTDPLMNQNILSGLANGGTRDPMMADLSAIFGGNPLGNSSSDGLMQMLRGSGPASLSGDLLRTGNPFDTSSMFDALAPLDMRQTDQQVAGLRAGAAGLGQRFGGAMMREESNLRSNIAEQINARNAGIQMQSFESAQGRRMQSLDQLLRAVGMNMDSSRQGNSLQLAAISQMFNQALAQRQYNQGLLSIQAGLPVGQYNAPGYGSALGDIGQLLAFAPMLRGN